VSEACGWSVEEELRKRIRAEHDGELLVGQAIVVRLPALPRPMIYAPVWRTPRKLHGTLNVFLAVRAALLEARKNPRGAPIESIAFPAMGLGPGELDPRISARQIRYAYEIVTGQRGPGDKNMSQQIRRERKLISVPGAGKEDADEGEAPPGPAPASPEI
jgi:O-acetyl-ADP-ribose deacetylase (regulator of RNase III)